MTMLTIPLAGSRHCVLRVRIWTVIEYAAAAAFMLAVLLLAGLIDGGSL